MHRIILLVCFFAPLFTCAQSIEGLTGVADTSYSSHSALKNTLKTHPDIRLVPEQLSPRVLEKRDLHYCSGGVRPLSIDAFYPADTSRLHPAILIIHGGGWRSGNRFQHIPLAQRLATLGYVCFTVEYRLSTEALYPAAVKDLKTAVRWIRANAGRFHVDKNHITALGFSAGGQLAALLGNTNGNPELEGTLCYRDQSSAVQTIIDIDGILAFIHPESGEGDDSRSVSAATRWFGYAKSENPSLWHSASALTHVSRSTPPTLFLNSAVDRMHAGRADYIQKTTSFGIYTEVHTFENAPHSFILFDPWFEPSVRYIDQFLKKINGS